MRDRLMLESIFKCDDLNFNPVKEGLRSLSKIARKQTDNEIMSWIAEINRKNKDD